MRSTVPLPAFCRNPLVRDTVERDPAVLETYGRAPNRLVVALLGEDPVLSPAGEALTALAAGDGPLAATVDAEATERAVLGFLGDRPVVAASLDRAVSGALAESAAHRVVDLRSCAAQGLVPPDELGILAQAKALFHWHRQHGFCAKCGHATVPKSSRLCRECPACGAQHFPRTDPVVIMLVTRGTRCLLGRQARFAPGMYSCLAGFLSPGETLEDSVRREVHEEAGIRVGAVAYLASQPWPWPSSIMVGCHGEAETEAITLDRDELEDGRWFEREEVAAMLERRHPDGLSAPPPLAIAHHLLRRWMAGEAG